MPRRREVPKRVILPDPVYYSELATKFINNLMKRGKKTVAESIFYGALDIIGERVADQEPLDVFGRAVENVKPTLEVKSRRVGGATYQVPVEVSQKRRLSLSIRWIILKAKGRGEKTMRQRLAGELLDASENRGSAIKKREDTHKMAEANRAFAHYRW